MDLNKLEKNHGNSKVIASGHPVWKVKLIYNIDSSQRVKQNVSFCFGFF